MIPTYHLISPLKNTFFNGSNVFLRADLNIPIENGTILDDFRIKK